MAVILITGASMGIGEAFAREYARRGNHLVLVARSRDRLLALGRELGSRYSIAANVFAEDLSDAGATERIYEYCRSNGIVIDILVNCAGLSRAGEFTQMPLEKFDEIVSVNMLASARLARLFLPDMIAAGSGGIINVASLGGLQGVPGLGLYSATKSFMITLSEAMHMEVKNRGVSVVAVCPGFIDTGFLERTGHDASVIRLPLYSAEKVVRAAIKGFEKNRLRIFPTPLDAVLSFSQRFVSREVTIWLSGFFAGIVKR
ncbi:MAG: SDR family oxidoreductase [Chlorobium sp.]|nr:MAG: SDR family oxidoreductase [Chlorobium sp.]